MGTGRGSRWTAAARRESRAASPRCRWRSRRAPCAGPRASPPSCRRPPAPTSPAPSSSRSFRPADRVPDGCLRPVRPLAECDEGHIDLRRAEEAPFDHRFPGAGELAVDVLYEAGPLRFRGAGTEVDPGRAHRRRAGVVQQRDQPPPDVRVAPEAVVAALESLPQRREPPGLGPAAENVVVIVLQDDAPPGPYRADPVPPDLPGLPGLLENETRVRGVRPAPLLGPGRRDACRRPG